MRDVVAVQETHRRWDKARREFEYGSRARLRGEASWTLEERLVRAAELEQLRQEFLRAVEPFTGGRTLYRQG